MGYELRRFCTLHFQYRNTSSVTERERVPDVEGDRTPWFHFPAPDLDACWAQVFSPVGPIPVLNDGVLTGDVAISEADGAMWSAAEQHSAG